MIEGLWFRVCGLGLGVNVRNRLWAMEKLEYGKLHSLRTSKSACLSVHDVCGM